MLKLLPGPAKEWPKLPGLKAVTLSYPRTDIPPIEPDSVVLSRFASFELRNSESADSNLQTLRTQLVQTYLGPYPPTPINITGTTLTHAIYSTWYRSVD